LHVNIIQIKVKKHQKICRTNVTGDNKCNKDQNSKGGGENKIKIKIT